MACQNHDHDNCPTNNTSSYIIVVVLYILLAIILGSFII